MKKKWINYFIFSLAGFVIDESLKHYNITLPYSFMILFVNICLYKIRYKELIKNDKILGCFYKAIAFVVLPIIYSLLINL